MDASYWENVDSSFFKSYDTDPKTPKDKGFIDNLETPAGIGSKYAMLLTSYFKAPETGDYTFKASCDDSCQVYLSDSDNPLTKARIIEVEKWTGRYEWDK